MMRFRIRLKSKKESIIPFNYNRYLIGIVYKLLEKKDPDFARELHNSKGFKYFTFSELLIPKRKINKYGIVVKSDYIDWIVSSPDKKFLKNLLSGLLNLEFLQIKDQKYKIISLKEFNSKKSNVFKTLSPVYVYNKKEEKVIDLLPEDKEYVKALKDTFYKRYLNYFCQRPNKKKWEIEILDYKNKRVEIKKGIFLRCSHLKFKFLGLNDKEFEFLLDCGIGSRTSLGFGCLDTI